MLENVNILFLFSQFLFPNFQCHSGKLVHTKFTEIGTLIHIKFIHMQKLIDEGSKTYQFFSPFILQPTKPNLKNLN